MGLDPHCSLSSAYDAALLRFSHFNEQKACLGSWLFMLNPSPSGETLNPEKKYVTSGLGDPGAADIGHGCKDKHGRL